ncbi:hypothetical protein ACVW1C_005634 [Bradyrhizobium sp. USDA 4011]|jgi:hypothetical protein
MLPDGAIEERKRQLVVFDTHGAMPWHDNPEQ